MKLSQSGLFIWNIEFLKIKTKNWLNEPSVFIVLNMKPHKTSKHRRVTTIWFPLKESRNNETMNYL